MMCARLLRPASEQRRSRLFLLSERFFTALHDAYRVSLDWALAHSRLMMLVLAATVGLNVYLYSIIPKGFFPQQDTGRIMGNIQADQSISFQAMQQKLVNYVELVRADPAVENVTAFTGGGQRNTANMFIALKPLAEREVSVDKMIARLRPKLAREPGANLFLQAQQDIRVGGRPGNAQYQYTLQADNIEEMRLWEPRIRQAFSQIPILADLSTDTQNKGTQTSLVIDRDAAARLGISVQLIDSTLNNYFGQRLVSTIYNPLNQYRVVMEAAPKYWQSQEALKEVYVITPKTATGKAAVVPLSAIAHYETTSTPLAVNHQGQFAASTISFNLTVGASLSDATREIDNALHRLGVPSSVHGSFQGTAKTFQQSLNNQPLLILAALVAVYLVLGILYESLVHPLTIISTLPSAGVGALLALLLFKTEFSVIALIGVILLIGIVKKNAIMMIDFAIAAERSESLSPEEAIRQACLLRFRPIMMTTMAALLGAVPLALGFSDGSEFRRPLGISIVGGLILSQMLTLYTTPVVYLYFDRCRLWVARRRARQTAVLC